MFANFKRGQMQIQGGDPHIIYNILSVVNNVSTAHIAFWSSVKCQVKGLPQKWYPFSSDVSLHPRLISASDSYTVH